MSLNSPEHTGNIFLKFFTVGGTGISEEESLTFALNTIQRLSITSKKSQDFMVRLYLFGKGVS